VYKTHYIERTFENRGHVVEIWDIILIKTMKIAMLRGLLRIEAMRWKSGTSLQPDDVGLIQIFKSQCPGTID
jgi:hypothetical protein